MKWPRMSHPLRKCLVFVFLGLWLFASCREKPAPASPTLVRINDTRITLAQFQDEFSRTFPLWEKLPAAEKTGVKKAFIAEMINTRLILAEAARRSVSIPKAAVEKSFQGFWGEYPPEKREALLKDRNMTAEQWKMAERQRLLLQKTAQQAVYDDLRLTDKEVEVYYREHFKALKGQDEVHARQILLSSQESARKALSLLRQGQPFAEVARRHSLSPDAAQGGDLGFFPRGQMPAEFDAVVFTLPPGKISDIVKSAYGFHIFLVEEHRKAVQPSLEEATPEIRALLLERKKEKAYNDWLARLRAKAVIQVSWSLLATQDKKKS